MNKYGCIKLIMLCIVQWIAGSTDAQQVSVQMPRNQGYVGIPMKFVVVYENITEKAEPVIPTIDGFTIQRLPLEQTFNQSSKINGIETSLSTRIITFLFTPQREGTLTIPPITFLADGKAFQSTERKILVEQPPTGGSLKATVSGPSGDIYLGQPIDLELQIIIEAFTDPELAITLNEQNMYSTIRSDSTFGIFAAAKQEGRVQVQQVQGNTETGIPTTFYVYSIRTTIWPETVGPFEMDPITVFTNYPISLSRQSSFGFFGGSSLSIDQTQLISAKATLPEIEVLPTPRGGKPEWFTGAVGTYDFHIVAEPTHVKVGEPVTLTMRITDLTQGSINLDYLSAPLLSGMRSLTNDFKVSDEPLGGTVDGRTKIFTQSIRPKTDEVTSIPPIPMSSFNPVTGQYQTIWSKAIPVTVDPVATVSTSDLVGGTDRSPQRKPNHLTEVEGGILANYTGQALLASQTVSITPMLIASFVTPPAAFGAILCTALYRKRKRTPASHRKKAFKQIAYSLRKASELQGAPQATHISASLRVFLHDIDQSIDSQQSEQVNTLLKRCDASQFGGNRDDTLVEDTRVFVEKIQ